MQLTNGQDEASLGVDTTTTAIRRDESRPDWCNEKIFQRNRLPSRTYYIPDTSVLLNGEWSFNYAPTPQHAPDPRIYRNGFVGSPRERLPEQIPSSRAEKMDWAPVTVPGH